MNFVKKYLPVIAEMGMLLLIIGLFINILSSIVLYGNRVSESNLEKARAEEYSRFAQYDGIPVTGSKVLSAIRQYSREVEFFVYVRNSSGMFGVDVAHNGNACFTPNITDMTTSNSKTSTCVTTIENLKDENHSSYVPINGMYKPNLLRDPSGRISGIYFNKTN